MEKIKVRLTFTESILGTSPNNSEIFREYIASKAPNTATEEEECDALALNEQAEKGTSVFPRTEDGRPFIYDYQIKGMFKDACSMLSRLKNGNESSKIKAYKKVIDGLIFPAPREIPFDFDGEVGTCQRPLRAQTPQGERVALAMSEEIPKGAQITFEVKCLDKALVPAVREWLDYGALRGLGQWRNGGHGTFEWEEIADE